MSARVPVAPLLFALVSLALAPALYALTARAHGVPAAVGQIAFDPRDPDHVVVRTTWGFLTTRDRGASWTWQCAAAVPFDGTREEPTIAVVSSGAIVAATFDGLALSDGAGCEWSRPETAPQHTYVTDLTIDPTGERIVWCIESSGVRPDAVYRSDDGGATWALIGTPHERALTDRIRVASSRPSRIYTSGVIPRTATSPREGVLLRSDDRGKTWTPLPVVLEKGERTVFLLGIDPTSPDRLLARTVRGATDPLPERILRSEDGGVTWTTVLEVAHVSGFAASEDGRWVWIGNRDGGLYRSTDGGRTFTTIDASLRVRAIAYRPGELWIGVDGFAHRYAIGISRDGGDTITPVWSFSDIVDALGCSAESTVGRICPAFWPDVAGDLRPDGGLLGDAGIPLDGGSSADGAPEAPDAGAGFGGSEAGCACRAVGTRARESACAPAGLVLALFVVVLGRQRTRPRGDRAHLRAGIARSRATSPSKIPIGS
jgi:photosystem II stability/assembly factor-like uncharacterized protein